MELKSLFANGLPKELEQLQEGQIYMFPCVEDGLTEKNVLISQYISAVSGKLIKESKSKKKKPVVFAIPTSKQALWNHIVCKLDTPSGLIIEIADTGSLLEMLYDYFGLDYTTPYNLKISDRHKITPAEYHPQKFTLHDIPSCSTEDESSDYNSTSIDFITNKKKTREDINKNILSAFYDAEYNREKFGVEYSLEELVKEFNTQKNKTYRLEIVPEEVAHPKAGKERTRINCHIYITDENEERTEIELQAYQKGIYLLFLLHKDGILLRHFNKEWKPQRYKQIMDLYYSIQCKLANNNYIEFPKLKIGDLNSIRTKIKDQISKITTNKKYIEMFAIEGYAEQPFGIKAATQEHRNLIVESFGLELGEFGL